MSNTPAPVLSPDPDPLSDYDIELIHDGEMIPSEKAIRSMTAEIRKCRGDPDFRTEKAKKEGK